MTRRDETTDRERYERAVSLFRIACELPRNERARFLDRECRDDEAMRREVEELLANDDAPSSVVDVAMQGGVQDALVEDLANEISSADAHGDADATGPLRGRSIRALAALDGFSIVSEIGSGGMGVVYEARQHHPARTVAIKVIRPDIANEEILRRFRREADALGRLQHRGIAQVYEAGVARRDETEAEPDVPYLVMEHIDGTTLDVWLDQHEPDVESTLRLFANICDAVQHAHQKGVIHRDLKPSNILVDATATPKILDFGVARLTERDSDTTTYETHPGRIIGTLAYMSPEQTRSEEDSLDTRTDVYALGAILYEALAGRRPHALTGRSLPEAARIVHEEDPPRIGSLVPRFRGDLETIVHKALEKDRDRRYASAAALATDIRRFLRQQPITARPPTALYQFGRFAARNKSLVAGLAGLFLVVTTGFAVSTVLYLDAERARDGEARETARAVAARERESRRAAEASAVTTLLVDALAQANPETNPDGRTMTVWQMLDDAAARIDDALEEQPELEATVRLVIGRAYDSQGRHREAREHFERVVALLRSDETTGTVRFSEALFVLSATLESLGELEAAARICSEGLERIDEPPPGDDKFVDPHELRAQRAAGLERLASIRVASSDFEGAAQVLDEATRILRELHGEGSDELASAHNNLGALYWHLARYEDAERSYRSALASQRALHGDRHPSVATTLGNLAVVVKSAGRIDEAEPLYEEALEIFRHAYGESHPLIANTLNNIARLHEARGNLEPAERLLREALEMRVAVHGPEHIDVAAAMHNLGMLLQLREQWAEAEDLLRRAFDMRRESLGDHASVAESHLALANAARHRGDDVERVDHLREAVRIRRGVFGPGSYLAFALLELGDALVAERVFGEADTILAEGLSMLRQASPETRGAIARGLFDHARALEALGRPEEALREARECLAIRRDILDPTAADLEAARALVRRLDDA